MVKVLAGTHDVVYGLSIEPIDLKINNFTVVIYKIITFFLILSILTLNVSALILF